MGQKHLIALREGYRESAEIWGELLKDCRQRGLNEPACWIADGASGLWAAVHEHSPRSAQPRCTNQKTMNVVDKLPKTEQPEATTRVPAIWPAPSAGTAQKLAAQVIHVFRPGGYERAADCLANDLDRGVKFYQFPEPLGSHLRATNVVDERRMRREHS